MSNNKLQKVQTGSFSCVSVILGAVNEAVGIRDTVHAVLDTCDHRDLAEILIMRSQRITPKCLESINALRDESTDVPVNIYLESEPHVGCAIRDAIGYAKGSHGVLLTSDFGIHPECLAGMIEAAKRTPDAVIKTSRRADSGGFIEYNRLRKAANKLGNRFLALLFNSKLKDITNGALLFPVELYRSIRWQEKDFTLLLEVTLKPLRLKADFVEVPARSFPRKEGKSNNSLRKTLAYLPAAVKYRFMPIKKFYPFDS